MPPAAWGRVLGFAKVAKREAFPYLSQDQLFEFPTDATPSDALKLQ